MSLYQYRKSHCGDKTILRPSYLHNGISFTGNDDIFILNQGPGPYIVNTVAVDDLAMPESRALIQYKDVILPV